MRSVLVGEVDAPDPDDQGNGPDDVVARPGDVALWALVDAARPLAPERAVDMLRLAGLDDIQDVDLNELEHRLRQLQLALRGADTLRRRTVRVLLVATLKAAKVSGAAGLADAAIGEPGEPTTDVATTPFLADEVPWPARVVGAGLLDTLVATVRPYVVLPTVHAARAIALWVVLTY